MTLLVLFVCMCLVGIVGLGVYLITERRLDRRYQRVINQYLNAETLIEDHVRRHVLIDKDWEWATGYAPIVTFGIKEDFTLMTDGELREAKEMAAKKMREEVGIAESD